MTRAHLAELERGARGASPLEACGFLVGHARGAATVVELVSCARNLRREPGAFEIDPVDHLEVDRDATERGLEIVGVWHSHVDCEASPSARDRAAAERAWWHVIVAPNSDRASVRAWREVDGELREHELGIQE